MTHRLPPSESLTVEFKSDRKRLSDNELVEALVCLANSDGGELWLGVEDDGAPTGLHADHQMLVGLPGLVAARTSPSLNVTVESLSLDGVAVARIAVPKAVSEVATASGVYVRRRLKHDGTPECVPMLPHDRISRAATLGLLDVSAQPVSGATLADFNPLERERLRQAVQKYGGDRVLLELDDEAMDGALGLSVRLPDGQRVPSLAGLLIIGREEALRRLVPTHEFAFQVLAEQAVRFNEFRNVPLLHAIEWLETNFRPYNPEEELQVGLFRVPVPKVDLGAFREAVANALTGNGGHSAPSLLFPMESVFEAFVAKHLARQVVRPLLLKTQARSQHLVLHRDQNWFRLKPDLLIRDADRDLLVLDTKWKVLDEAMSNGTKKYGLAQGDFYQLQAYGQSYLSGQGDVILIYPKTASFQFPLPVFEFPKSEGLRLWVLPFCLETRRLSDPPREPFASTFRSKGAGAINASVSVAAGSIP